MLESLTIPAPQPVKKVPGYKMPESAEHLLDWQFVVDQMTHAQYYWIASVNRKSAPHVVPVWGIWFENRVYFDGSPQTGWARNLQANGQIAVHLPSGEQVVVVEGYAKTLADDELNAAEWALIDGIYQKKYNVQTGSPYWYVDPTKVIAWDGGDLLTMTRWIFA